MAIRVVTMTNPAAGHDWLFTVPAQWLPYLYGVTAVLTTGTAQTTIPDESGNGHDLTIAGSTSHYGFGATGPFAGGALNYAVTGDAANVTPNWLAQGALTTAFSTAAITAEYWLKLPALHTAVSSNVAGVCNNNGTLNAYQIQNLNSFTLVDRPAGDSSGVSFTFIGGGIVDTNWHHVAVTNDGVNYKWYLDGALMDTEAGAVGQIGANLKPTLPGGFGVRALEGRLAGVAFYTSALAQATIAAHAAANGSASAYKTSVLASTPQGLWMLNGANPGPSRTVDLVVTDGTNKVAEFPAGLAPTTAPSFTYSWQNLGTAIASTTDGSTITVPIPELAVDAGYTIGARTLDLAGTDQWSQITLWFDDGTGATAPGGGPIPVGYLNALLVPDYSHRGG